MNHLSVLSDYTQLSVLKKYQLSGEYITSAEVDIKLEPYDLETDAVNRLSVLSDYAMLSDVPTNASQLVNDVPYLSSHQSLSDYYTKYETSAAVELDDEFAKYQLSGDYVTSAGLSTTLSSYAMLSAVPTNTSQLINDVPFLTRGGLPTDIARLSDLENYIHLSGEVDKMIGPLHLSSNFAVGPYSHSQSLGSFACGGEAASVPAQAIVSGMYVMRVLSCAGEVAEISAEGAKGYYRRAGGEWLSAANSELVISSNTDGGCGYMWSTCKNASGVPDNAWIELPEYTSEDASLSSYRWMLSVGPALSDSLAEMETALTGYTDACFTINATLYCDPHTVAGVVPAKGLVCFNEDSPDMYLSSSFKTTDYRPSDISKGPYAHKMFFYKHPSLQGNWSFAAHGPAFAFGEDVVAAADDSFATGCRSYAIGRGGTSIGVHTEAGAYAIAAGYGARAYAYGSMAVGAASY